MADAERIADRYLSPKLYAPEHPRLDDAGLGKLEIAEE